MASGKKASDSDKKQSRTSTNKAKASARNDLRTAKMVERTQKLIGQHVHYRTAGRRQPLEGTVTDVLRKGDEGYPEAYSHQNPDGCHRKYGAFVKIRTPDGHKTVSRHRVKLIKKGK